VCRKRAYISLNDLHESKWSIKTCLRYFVVKKWHIRSLRSMQQFLSRNSSLFNRAPPLRHRRASRVNIYGNKVTAWSVHFRKTYVSHLAHTQSKFAARLFSWGISWCSVAAFGWAAFIPSLSTRTWTSWSPRNRFSGHFVSWHGSFSPQSSLMRYFCTANLVKNSERVDFL